MGADDVPGWTEGTVAVAAVPGVDVGREAGVVVTGAAEMGGAGDGVRFEVGLDRMRSSSASLLFFIFCCCGVGELRLSGVRALSSLVLTANRSASPFSSFAVVKICNITYSVNIPQQVI